MPETTVFRKLLFPFSLAFKDTQVERDFLTDYYRNSLAHVRRVMFISLLIYGAFGVLDYIIYPEIANLFLKIRFLLVAPLVLLTILYSHHKSAHRKLQFAASLNIIVAGLGIMYMLFAGGRELALVYYVGLMLVFIFNYDFLKLRFVWASLTGAILLLFYYLTAVLVGFDSKMLIASLFFLVSANIMGMVSAYFYEFINRKYYYSNRLLKIEEEKTHEINLNLENQVKERTATLEYANKLLFEAKEVAVESERLKSVFLATMSHELRTPLNAIIGFSDLISAGEIEEEKEYREYASVIHKSGTHLLSLVENLFDITLIDSGQIKLVTGEFNLSDLMQEVHTIMNVEKFKIEKESIDIQMEKGNIELDFKIVTDGHKIRQVLLNLLKNAIKFTESGVVKFWCDEVTENNKTALKFYVQDTGIGIPLEKTDLIFDVFRQVDDSHSRKFGGVGIGLTVVKKLVTMLGGEVGVESTVDHGSTFFFTVRNYVKDEFLPKIKNVSEQELTVSANTKALIVEDDEASYFLLKLLLEKYKIESDWASDGETALEIIRKNPKYKLVFMDINMPVLNGYDTTKAIRKSSPDQIIIAQTAYAIEGDREKVLEAGCNAYMSKPISPKKLHSILAEVL
ncbi:MAG: response regulator [Bacteroidales bacterium]|nr:response regulator [Bacteroidales bacterium]